MIKETFPVNIIPDFRQLLYGDDIYDKDTDELQYEYIQSSIEYVDLEKCYKIIRIIFKRILDNTFFECRYNYSYHWEDDDAIATQVFPKEETITVYE